MVTFTKRHKETVERIQSDLAILYALLAAQNTLLRSAQTYGSLAAMKAENSPLQVKFFVLLGQNTAGDGLKSGQYYYDEYSSATPNDHSVIQLTSTPNGRLIKLL